MPGGTTSLYDNIGFGPLYEFNYSVYYVILYIDI